MGKYRKKPVVIDAVQFDGTLDGAYRIQDIYHTIGVETSDKGVRLLILTLEGRMTAEQGDWIICGIKGELYPCKPDIFEATYELV